MTELSRSQSRLITGLARRKVRETEGLFIAEGVRVVEELVRCGLGIRLAVASPSLEETERGRALSRALEGRGELVRVGPGQMDALADTRTSQGVLVVAEAPRAALEALSLGDRATALLLDGVQDPGNLGTLARAAAAFGCAALVCLPGTVDAWNPKAVRASAGALFRIPVVPAGEEALDWLRSAGFAILGADAAGDDVAAASVRGRTALVVGNEGAGLAPGVRDRCDRIVRVPMVEGSESLNVAVAAGILLYVITRGHA